MKTPPKEKAISYMQRFKAAYPKLSHEEIKERCIEAGYQMVSIYTKEYESKKVDYWMEVIKNLQEL